MIEGRQISFRMSSEELAKMRECMAKCTDCKKTVSSNVNLPYLKEYRCTPAWALWAHYGLPPIPAPYIDCPTGCDLPHTCATCGRRSCYAVDSGNEDEDDSLCSCPLGGDGE